MIWVIIVIGIVIVGAIGAAVSLQGKQQVFVDLGDVTGKTPDEIIARVGQPSSISAAGPGQELYQWMETNSAGGYHYALLFEDGKCKGFTHQYVQ